MAARKPPPAKRRERDAPDDGDPLAKTAARLVAQSREMRRILYGTRPIGTWGRDSLGRRGVAAEQLRRDFLCTHEWRSKAAAAPPTTNGTSVALAVVPAAADQLALTAKPTAEQATTATVVRIVSAAADGGETASVVQMRHRPRHAAPVTRPKWELMRVVSGHAGWVRALAVDPGNEWFATGGNDRMVKIWDLASGQLRLSLTGHIAAVRGLAISARQPYLFSAGEDRMVKCWDLETNKVVRHYHGHLSGVFAVALHPTLNLVITGGRDSCVRVWDMRTRAQVFAFTGHASTVAALAAREAGPQIVSGSMDSTVRLWDLAAGRCAETLTHHKKGVRAVSLRPDVPREFLTGGADGVKQYVTADGGPTRLARKMPHDALVSALAATADGLAFSGADNGSMRLWDWASGTCVQELSAPAQPGSLDCEQGVFCASFDMSGSRLLTGDADKTVKVWRPVS